MEPPRVASTMFNRDHVLFQTNFEDPFFRKGDDVSFDDPILAKPDTTKFDDPLLATDKLDSIKKPTDDDN